MDELISGVTLTNLKVIRGENGDVFHALKSSESSFSRFGEAYFSSVKKGFIKGWKKHSLMTLNLVVPVGAIRFIVFDDRTNSATFGKFNEFTIGLEYEYARLTIEPNLWLAFQGVGENLNLLLNLANIEHDPSEAENLPIENKTIPFFNWQ